MSPDQMFSTGHKNLWFNFNMVCVWSFFNLVLLFLLRFPLLLFQPKLIFYALFPLLLMSLVKQHSSTSIFYLKQYGFVRFFISCFRATASWHNNNMQVCINEKQKLELMRTAQTLKASPTISLERQLPFTQHSNSLLLVTDK